MASFRKLKSGNWQVQVRRVDLPNITRTFSTKKLAVQFAREVETDTELARKLGKTPATIPYFKDWADTYLRHYQGRDPDTVGKLRWWSEFFGNRRVTEIDEFLVDEGLVQLSQKVTNSTVNRYKSTLSAVFIAFIRHPEYKKAGFTNPTRKESVSRFKENPAKNRFLSPGEQAALLNACKKAQWDKLYLLVLMALTTGARKGELLSIKWDEIDFAARVVLRKRTKNNKQRYLPLTNPVLQELMKFRKCDDSLVFHNTVSHHRPYDIKKAFAKAVEQSGLQNLRFHDLRHTSASNLVRSGRTLFEVGTLLGHSSITMTQRYSHLATKDTQDMVESVMGSLK